MSVVQFSAEDGVRGWLHLPARSSGDVILMTHGAGADCNSKLLAAAANAMESAGFVVLRFDLPFRQERRHGPPRFGSAKRDREGIRRAAAAMRDKAGRQGRIFLGGHSYGGRQSSLLLAEEPQAADGLLLLSYPLHPPRKPDQVRTGHFPKLTRPSFFVHGTRDPFGSTEEMKCALELIPAVHAVMEIDGAGHELLSKSGSTELPGRIAAGFQSFISHFA
ncbi:MAG TPA: alpha/beta fold hydrolase [Candidatus Acidoferrum sp.]|nr:alpha/beta fold hydrolase [Candidatus Acidoferrum sp.]